MSAVMIDSHPVLAAALEAAEAGLAVIYQRGKKAVAAGWNKGPPLTADELRGTFRPDLNVAFRAGPSSLIDGDAVVVLDVDMRSEDATDKAEARAAYAELVGDIKPTVRTGGGGAHLYLRVPADRLPMQPATILRQSQLRLPDTNGKPGKPAWTIELLAAEHACTMPPSIHPSGKPYRWVGTGLAHIARAPQLLLDAVPSTSSVVKAMARTVPEPLPEPLPSVPPLDPDLLPECVRGWCADIADGLNVPIDFTGVPAMVALAGAIGRSVAVALKQHGQWHERPVLWGCVIGRPSSGKSPALNPARSMLQRLERIEGEAHQQKLREHEARSMLSDAAKSNARDAIRKAMKAGKPNDAEALAMQIVDDTEAPPEPRIVANDSTVEKLGELLNANPRGLVQYRDELAGWLANLDREGREGDRTFWLECWNGTGAYTVDRIGRGTVRIEACAVSILGGMQPGKLDAYVCGAVRGGFSDDGLIQRFQLAVYPDLPATWRYCDRAPQPQAELKAWEAFKRLRALDPVTIGAEVDERCDLPILRLSREAMAMFVLWQTELMQRLRAGDEPAWMESHMSKYPALAGRLALVLHLADGCTGDIGVEAMARALGWCDYLEAHARRIYAPMTDGGVSVGHRLLRKRSDLPDGFTARGVYRRGWSGLTDADAVAEGLEVLCEYGHLRSQPSESGGRPTMAYVWVQA